jgi:hypothetical protein
MSSGHPADRIASVIPTNLQGRIPFRVRVKDGDSSFVGMTEPYEAGHHLVKAGLLNLNSSSAKLPLSFIADTLQQYAYTL